MKYSIFAMLFALSQLSNLAIAGPIPSVGIHFHPLDVNGNWDGSTRSVFEVGERIQFHNKYKIPLWQQDGWKVKDSGGNLMFGCNVAYDFNNCEMRYFGEGCDDQEPIRSFSEPGVYTVKLLGTGPGYCAIQTVEKTITINGAATTNDPIIPSGADLAWLVPVINYLLM